MAEDIQEEYRSLSSLNWWKGVAARVAQVAISILSLLLFGFYMLYAAKLLLVTIPQNGVVLWNDLAFF